MLKTSLLSFFIRRAAVVAFAAGTIHCTFIAKSDLKAGLGQACGGDSDCQASICNGGLCTTHCNVDSDCSAPNLCFTSFCKLGCKIDAQCPTGQQCSVGTAACVPIPPTTKLVALVPGKADGSDGWSTSHKLGLDDAVGRFSSQFKYGADPYKLVTEQRDAVAIDKTIEAAVADGARIVVTTTQVGTDESIKEAAKYPDVKFVSAGSRKNGNVNNVGVYDSQTEQGWYVAGRVAAREAGRGNKCIGMILPTPTHKIIRETNAFTRGARFQQNDVKVVIRWLGGTVDPSAPSFSYHATNFTYDSGGPKFHREELLAAQLLDLGCTVVAHRTESQRIVRTVEDTLKGPAKGATGGADVFTMGVDIKDACRSDFTSSGTWIQSCLGSPYLNWSGTYAKALDQIQKGTWKGGIDLAPFRSDADAILKFELSPYPNITNVQADDLTTYTIDAADKGFDQVFKGPLTFNGQRDLDGDGKPDASQNVIPGIPIDDAELARMCWFIQGVYEMTDPTTVTTASLIPAMVPYGPPVTGQTTTLDQASKTKYGDVIAFVSSINQDPSTSMSCPLSP